MLWASLSEKERALRAHVAFYQGECYRILNNPKATNAYQNAIRNRYQDSIVYLRYAQVLQYQGKYRDADKNYLIYLEAHPTDYQAQAGHYACGQVEGWRKQPSRYKVSPAKEFNAKRSSNFAPAFVGENADALMLRVIAKRAKATARKNCNAPVR